MGNTDVLRGANSAVALYDMLIDSDLISASDRTLFRAQLAYLGYLMDDPKCWSMERGYCSGNPNMSCSYTLSLGVLACALSDHPAAQGWADRATQWMDQWLADEVGPNGEWISEGSHYGHVSLVSMMAYAIAARRAGFHDFSNDPRFKRLLLYFAKFSSARDAWRDNRRGVSRAYGRGVSSNPLGWRGMAAAFFRKSDPELSRTLQWMWSENGYPISMDENRCGALEPYYEDRRLPAAAPAWGSELFPELGAILRAGFNTPSESFIMVLSSVQSRRNLDCARGEVGGIAQWCGRGKPLAACFFLRGYEDRNELLCNGVRLARNWGAPEDKKAPYGHYTITRFGAFAALPSADYVRSSFENTLTDDRDWLPDNVPAFPKVTPATGTNLVWTRQLLFVKDPDPAGPAWLALRDTTRGGNPTAWQFWTFSEKVGTPQQAGNPAAFLADAPGHTNQPARELPLGDRYTALGQFGVDVEYFIASPAKTPRHTLRFGGIWNNTFPDYEDLLHLQLPGDGAYAVALFPRPREEAPPSFTALAGGAVTKVAGAFGSDYAFLSMDPAEAKTVDATFRGTAGSVQERPGTTILALPVEGAVAFKGYALSASMAASLRVEKDALTLDFTAGHQGGDVTIQAPGAWKAEKAGTTKTARNDKGQWVLTVPAGTKSLRLVKE